MDARPYLRCLGTPALLTSTSEPIRFRTKKHLALLIYLAVEGRRSHPRDRLAELLWPNVSLPEARHSLATGLSLLRPRVGAAVLESGREVVSLARDRLALDLDRLEAGDILGGEGAGPLEVAAFLDGFEIPDASEFMMWKDRQHSRLLPAITDALILLIDRSRRTGDSRQIEQLADRMLAIDELSEAAIRAKMEARAFAGDRLTALRIFEEWKGKLAEEVGAAPSELVEGMAVRLRRRGWERTTLTEIPTVPTDQWRGRPFVGRAAEFQVLYEAWEGMRKGTPGHALILGDSGVGKTTLVERLTTAAGLEGAAISRVQCYDLEREIPYSTLGSLILDCLDRPGASATRPDALGELARMVPEVRRRFPSIPASGDSQGETARIRLTESFHELTQAIAEEHPVILVVDDFHLADDASLAVLHLLMRRARGQAIMLILIARPGELPHSPHAARLQDSAPALGIRELDLTPLGEEHSREMLDSLVSADQSPPNASVRRTLLRAAAGFPMVLELLLRDWQANGDQSLALAMDAMTAELGAGREPSTTYRQIVARIIRSLDPVTQKALNLAAILGHRVNDLAMYDLIDLTLGQSVAAITQLKELRVLRDGTRGMEFSNELIRAHVYSAIPSPVRKILHAGIADRLLTTRPKTVQSSGLEIAWHCTRAGRTAEATPHLLEGAREAIRHGAPHVAERALSSALAHLDLPERARATLLLTEALQEQGRWTDSLASLARLGEHKDSEWHDESLVLSGLAKMHVSSSATLELLAHVPELTEIISRSANLRIRVRAGRVLAYLIGERRDEAHARQLLEAVDTIPQSELDADSLAELTLTRALLLFQIHETSASLEQVTRAVADLTEHGAASMVVQHLHAGLGAIHMKLGRYDQAAVHCEQALRMAHRLANESLVASSTANLALCCLRMGKYEELLGWIAKLTNVWGPEFIGFVEIQLSYCVALAHAFQGRHQEALDTVLALDRRLAGPVQPWMVQSWLLWKADVFLVVRRMADAVSAGCEALEANGFQLLSPAFAGPFARWVALTADCHEAVEAREIVHHLTTQVDDYDALDQAEVLCAAHHLERKRRRASPELLEAIRGRLAGLPYAVRGHLAALQMLPPL